MGLEHLATSDVWRRDAPGSSQFPGVQIEGGGLDMKLRPVRWCLDLESAGRWGGQAGDSLQVFWATVKPGRRDLGRPGPEGAGRGDTAQDCVTMDTREREASFGDPSALRRRGPDWRRPRWGSQAGPASPRPRCSRGFAVPTLLSWRRARGEEAVVSRG